MLVYKLYIDKQVYTYLFLFISYYKCFLEFFNYKHISEEIWYSENNMDYLICQDENKEDSNCSNSCSPLKCTSFDDHLNYMNISMGNDGLC